MNERYCNQQYTIENDPILMCKAQLQTYARKPLHKPCDKTRKEASTCEHLPEVVESHSFTPKPDFGKKAKTTGIGWGFQ